MQPKYTIETFSYKLLLAIVDGLHASKFADLIALAAIKSV
jgi:hypothetical protein